MSEPIVFPSPAPAPAEVAPLNDLIPDATLPSKVLAEDYEALLRHVGSLPELVAPHFGSLRRLAAAIVDDHDAGLSRDLVRDYIQTIEQLRDLKGLIERETVLLAVIALRVGVSIPVAAEAAGMAPNTLRRRLTTTSESMTREEGAESDSPF